MNNINLGTIKVLDKYGISHDNGTINFDKWAEKFDCTIIEKELRRGDTRAIVISLGYGSGWSTENNFEDEDFTAANAATNLIALEVLAKYGNGEQIDRQVFADYDELLEARGMAEELYHALSEEKRSKYINALGVDGLEVHWLDKDEKLIIHNNDGYEEIENLGYLNII